jgi:mannose-6-phosphate isomerase-like protein (cupin superfamily)
MAYTIFRPGEVEWTPRAEDDSRSIARLSDALTQSRANLWRYPPGTKGKRHLDRAQEEVFVVLEGMLTVDLGDPPERHEVPRGGVLVVESGTILQLPRCRIASVAAAGAATGTGCRSRHGRFCRGGPLEHDVAVAGVHAHGVAVDELALEQA